MSANLPSLIPFRNSLRKRQDMGPYGRVLYRRSRNQLSILPFRASCVRTNYQLCGSGQNVRKPLEWLCQCLMRQLRIPHNLQCFWNLRDAAANANTYSQSQHLWAFHR